MILVAIGANLPSERFGPPRASCDAAVIALGKTPGIEVLRRSSWYESAPIPASSQPWYVNGVVELQTDLGPRELLTQLHRIEAVFGRVREVRNAPRVLDLDLICHGGSQIDEDGLTLPHPRLGARAFVLRPIAELDADWRHPVTGDAVAALIEALPKDQEIRIIS